jgi:hypothetical protein
LVRLIQGTPSSLLVASGFGFALPPAAHVSGITLTVTRWSRDEDNIYDQAIRLLKRGTIGTADRSRPENWSAAPTTIDYGGPTDLWSNPWSASDVNRSDFAAALQAEYRFVSGNNDASVDAMRVTVHYCE